jgi:hypothetical protein
VTALTALRTMHIVGTCWNMTASTGEQLQLLRACIALPRLTYLKLSAGILCDLARQTQAGASAVDVLRCKGCVITYVEEVCRSDVNSKRNVICHAYRPATRFPLLLRDGLAVQPKVSQKRAQLHEARACKSPGATRC